MLIVGLGNIGKQYEKTPHNAGFIFVDRLYDKLDRQQSIADSDILMLEKWKEVRDFNSLVAIARDSGKIKYIFAKPTTLMNLSGDAVAKLISYYKLNAATDLIVAYDDMDIEIGKYKITFAKYPKTHNGVNDILKRYKNFTSIRIGIGKPVDAVGAEYVLSKLTKSNHEQLLSAIDSAILEIIQQIDKEIEKG